MKYYIIAGEPSGDLHGSNLIKGIVSKDADAQIKFWGGDLMASAAGDKGDLVRHYREESVMGFVEVVKKLPKIQKSMQFCRDDIKAYQPDVLILIDYPGFNLRMAKYAKSIGITVLYYIAPKVWAWKEKRVYKIKKYVDRLYAIFPFEVDYFSKFGIDTFYGGNPLVDSLQQYKSQPIEDFMKANSLDDRKIIALVPGSRKHEIDFNLPIMVGVASRMPEYQFVITGVNWLDKQIYDKITDGVENVRFVLDQTQQTLAHSCAALVTSGTATLETALMGTPQVVCFRGPKVTMAIAAILVKIKWISLVNIVMQRTVVEELIQDKLTIDNAYNELIAILPGGAKAQTMREDYEKLADQIGGAGASERVADDIIKYLNR